MKIIINDDDVDILGWGVNAEFEISGEADADEALEAFVRAMLLDGYAECSVAKAMITWLYENNIDIDTLIRDEGRCLYDKDEPLEGQISMFDGA